MKTIIYYTEADKRYTLTLENLNEEITAQEYIDCCRNNDSNYWQNDIDAIITADVYADDADPMFDDPVSSTTSIITEITEC